MNPKKDVNAAPTGLTLTSGLPMSVDSERFVLGSILMDDTRISEAAKSLTVEDFGLEKHRRIFRRMLDLHSRGARIDRVTISEELNRNRELESVDGVSYIVSLDDGLPRIQKLDSYIEIVKEKSALRRIIYQSQHTMNLALEGIDSSKAIIGKAVQDFYDSYPQSSSEGPCTMAQVLDEIPGGVNSFLHPEVAPTGLKTGFRRFDDMTGGLQPGELVCIGARPGHGKSTWLLNVAIQIATKLNRRVVFYSLEMTRKSLLTRAAAAMARVDSQKFAVGYTNEDERTRLLLAVTDLYERDNLLVDETTDISLMDIDSFLIRQKRAGTPIDLVCIDYLQLMRTPGVSRETNRVLELAAVTRGLKLMSKQYQIPILMAAQLNRKPDERKGTHRPMLSDLRECGSAEADSDIVAFLLREELYDQTNGDLSGKAEMIIAKSRNGPTGVFGLSFLKGLTKFENRAEDDGGSE